MWTKAQLLAEAFSEIGIADYEFDLTPEERATGLRRLDAMMGTWEALGIAVGYRMPSTPDASNLDDASGIPDSANETVYANLALRLAPVFGKTVSSETRLTARAGYDTLLTDAATPVEQQQPNTMPRGAGNRLSPVNRSPFMPTPDTGPLSIAEGGGLAIASE